MKILFCIPLPITKELGGSKVTVELAEAMQELGWECTVVGPNDILPKMGPCRRRWQLAYVEALRNFLRQEAHRYDVVEYDHEYLPYARNEFDLRPLFVARSVLLAHHLETIPIPTGRSLKSRVGALVKGSARRCERRERVQRAQATVEATDLVNVSNQDDRAELARRGVSADKIVVIPYGISESRRPLFEAISSAAPDKPRVAFVGTFDYRKGANEFPRIVHEIVSAIPGVRFRLLGTAGMFPSEAEVLAHFPPVLRPYVDVIPQYQPEQLPELLAPCSVGVFPSYIEGFGFGVLEMLASSIPVIAYDSPGPPMMLPPQYLVPRGDAAALAAKVIGLLNGSRRLSEARQWAKRQARNFTWTHAAAMTDSVYRRAMESSRVKKSMSHRQAGWAAKV